MASRLTRGGLSTNILVGLLAGVACGLFLGERAAFLSTVGDAFVGLLQMTVLPYITVALIANIGRLVPEEAKRFGAWTGAFLVTSTLATLTVIVLLPMSLPKKESASFFSTSLLEVPKQTHPLELFIPSNPFHSLANNVVPAVVLFCIAAGLAMMTLPNKAPALRQLDFVTSILARMNHFLVQLTPIGIFAIGASFAGTMHLEELVQLRVYLVIYTAAAALIGFGILIPLLSALTPFSYGEILRAVRAPALLAFVTGKVFIALPLLVESAEGLFTRSRLSAEKPTEYTQAVIPLAYSFPHAGKLLVLLFVPFSAWFVGQPIGLGAYPEFLLSGVFSLFGSPIAAIPFLLNLLHLPADMFQLFIVTGVFASRLGDALGAIHLLFVSVLTATALSGGLRFPFRRLSLTFFGIGLTILITMGVSRLYFGNTLTGEYDRDSIIGDMHSAIHETASIVHRSVPPPPDNFGEPALQRIRRTGVLRVGYLADDLPMSFFNAAGDLVGYNVDMANLLAAQLGVELEFIPFEMKTIEAQLERGDFDVAVSAVPMTPAQLERLRFGGPYMSATVALLVSDHRRDEFRDRISRRDFEGVRLAVVASATHGKFGSQLFPGATTVSIPHPRAFLNSNEREPVADALVWSAESGSAWTLLYPAYGVIPVQPIFRVPLGYPVARRDGDFADFLSRWIELTTAGPTDERLYDHWILGKGEDQREPRWSVIRDVLHWAE